jgi:hypothetical protein
VLLGDRGSRWRCLLVWMSGTSSLGAGASLIRGTGLRAWADRQSLGSLPLDRVLSEVAACVLLACLAWAWFALTVTVAEAWRGVPRRCRCGAPDGVRRLVLAACGVAVMSAGTSPALATAAPGHQDRFPRLHGAPLLTGLPLPERAVAPRRTHHREPDPQVVVVRPGDSLWVIARRELPPGATDADVIDRWHAIYAANRAVIGADPDLVRPGQRLLLPRKDPS